MGLVYKFGFRHHTFSLLSSSQQKPRRAEIISYLDAWARMSSKHVPTEIPRVGLIDWSAENICNFKIVIIMFWGYHHTVKVDTNNAWEHVWTFAGGFIYFVICEGTAGTQGVAQAWLWLYKGFVQHSGTVWRAEPMMGLQKSRSADIVKLAQEQSAGL